MANDESETAIDWPEQGSVWRHCHGSKYKVLGHVYLEATNEPAVAYRDATNELARIWVRSLKDWHAEVNQAGQRFRFEKDVTNNEH